MRRWAGVWFPWIFDAPPKPQPPILTLTQETFIHMLVYSVKSIASANDVVKTLVRVVVEGQEPADLEFPGVEGEIRLVEGTVATVTVRQVDSSGNVSEFSEPIVQEAKDTLAPPKPAPPVLTLVRQE